MKSSLIQNKNRNKTKALIPELRRRKPEMWILWILWILWVQGRGDMGWDGMGWMIFGGFISYFYLGYGH
jgi:hypothetical protein